MLDLLAGADLSSLTADQQVTAFIMARKIKAFADHVQLSILHDFEDTTEMAMAAHEPEQSVVRQKQRSLVLDRLPRLCEQLRRGELDLRQVEAVDERVVNLPSPAMITQVEDALVEAAPRLTRSQLARRATKAVAEVDPTGYDQRRLKAIRERRVEFTPLPDGMAQLRITLTALDARAAYDLLTQDGRAQVKDDCTTDQKRADAFLDRFLGYGVDRKVKVHVTIPMETLMGLTEDPGLLDGYGHIAADAARELAGQGPWQGLLLDEYRHAESLGTDTYRPPTAVKEFSALNGGGVCSAPGCIRPIGEFDHTVPWPQGKTNATQLKGYCTHHHHVKHGKSGDYVVTLDPDATLHWVTPLGRHYTTQPHQY
ncbi:DUF222 domain-containing protein [Kutzneria sp. CA-103260]|uniref:DUF222 domain-containing protein n=1 Tax=Kutzneria sp. CA-103260 TaxID=2802641 RepID=UPI001BA84505|nr:DUF222 domain-containing protein [Kutzneria sp. CA-103260]QUQ63448.1 hypothetical protein JJ691_11600 [Kutzneria sp. CA-103260]